VASQDLSILLLPQESSHRSVKKGYQQESHCVTFSGGGDLKIIWRSIPGKIESAHHEEEHCGVKSNRRGAVMALALEFQCMALGEKKEIQ
jgi:hypothetical protein